MGITTRYVTSTAALLVAVLLLMGCEEATETPKAENGPTTAPDETPRPPMGKPTDPQPRHRATRVAVDTNLGWSSAEGATSYVVFFGTDPTPDRDELRGEQAETSFDPGRMEYDTIYYWRVDSKNRIGTITGDAWRFRTEGIPIPKPGKAASPMPAHNATNVSSTTSLGWSPTPDATSYLVYLGTVPSLGTNELHGEQTGTTLQPDTALHSDTTYYWRVDTKNDGGTTVGDVWSFATEVQPPPKATGPQPENGATGVGILLICRGPRRPARQAMSCTSAPHRCLVPTSCKVSSPARHSMRRCSTTPFTTGAWTPRMTAARPLVTCGRSPRLHRANDAHGAVAGCGRLQVKVLKGTPLNPTSHAGHRSDVMPTAGHQRARQGRWNTPQHRARGPYQARSARS